ncbi:23S rRNA (guanosine(2251)-2'-O)-methyltransferase RlmB [bacterium]|nr:MAG: 23S rRNA (guanosine(2251)-2'-O)-methyltransferase RlmB [bacterium]
MISPNSRNDMHKDKHTPKQRTETIQVEGRNPVIETLRARSNITKLYLQKDIKQDEKITEVLSLANDQSIKVTYIDRKSLDKLSQTQVHQGVIALKSNSYRSNLELDMLIAKVEKSQRDPYFILVRESLYEYNLGAIIRTAVCAGVNGIILTHGSKVSPQVIRGSMGATEHIDFCYSNIFDAIKACQAKGIKVIGIEVSGENYYYEEDLTGPICFIIGGEDHPLSKEIIAKTDSCVKIPMFGDINSLNMSVAAGILLYEKVRQELV